MITQSQVAGKWKELKGKIQEEWGQLTDDDLHKVEGRVDQLVAMIQQKTGQAKEKIENTLESMTEECSSMMGKAGDTAKEYAGRATEMAKDYADRASEAVSHATEQVKQRAMDGYTDARRMVRRHPAESVAAAFCTGMIAGVIVGLTMRSR